MRILTTESFKRITPLMRENYANLHAQMEVKLSPDTAAMFARFTMQPSQGGAQWSVSLPDEDRLIPFTQASELEKDQISMAIKRAHAELRKAFPTLADKIVDVPDPEAIFFYTSGPRVQVVLTEWGFRRVRQQAATGIIRLCLERADVLTDSPVMIRMVNADGSVAANKEYTILIFNNEVSFTTDAAGFYNAGHVKVGTQFRIETPEGKKSEPFTVEKDREVYEVRLAMETSLTVHVQDKDGTGLKGIPALYNGESKPTDGQGNAVFGPLDFDGPHVVSVGAEGFAPVEHTLVADPEKNVVTFTLLPKLEEKPAGEEKKEEGELPPPPAPPGDMVRVQVLDKKGRPQCGLPVRVYCQMGFEDTVTDAEGWISLKRADLVPGEKPKIELTRPKPDGKRSKQKLGTPDNNNPQTPPPVPQS